MALEEKWITVITSAADTLRQFIRDNLGPSKKELEIKISELENLVDKLSDQNTKMSSDMAAITHTVLDQLSSEYNITVNADTITIIGKNTSNTQITTTQLEGNSITTQVTPQDNNYIPKIEEIFKDIDEEIASARGKTNTQLEEEYDISKYLTQK